MMQTPKPDSVTALLQRFGALFVADRLEEVARSWLYPCPVEVDGDLKVMRDAADMATFLRTRRALATRHGLKGLTARIIAIEVPRDGRFRVWFRWRFRLADRTAEDEDTTVYYMVRSPSGALLVEMMHLVHRTHEAPVPA